MKTIFLDFDGVLFNSVKEGYLLARYAYLDIDVFEPLDDGYTTFAANRYLISNSWQYYYIMRSLERGIVDMRDSFNLDMNNRDVVADGAFNKIFIERRKALIEYDYEFWQALDEPYDFFYDIKEILQAKTYDIVIVTTKNKLAIETTLMKHQVDFPSEKIFAKEDLVQYSSKGAFLEEYIRAHHVKQAYFVEDNANNLDSCKEIEGLTPLLVNWGYTDPSRQGLSRNEIIEELQK